MDYDNTKLMTKLSQRPWYCLTRLLPGANHGVHSFAVVVGLAVAFFNLPACAQGIGDAEIQFVDGTSTVANLERIAVGGGLSGEGLGDGLNLQDILSIQTRKKISKTSTDGIVVTVGGGEVFATDLVIADESASFRSADNDFRLPLQSLRALVWSTSSVVEKAIASPSKDNDQVIVQVPDGERVIEGILEGVDSEFVTINYKNQSRQIALSKTKAVVIADLELKSPQGSSARINIQDGSRFVGVIKQMSDDVLDLAVTGGAVLKLNAKNIVNITIASDRLLYLSDAEPVEAQEKSLFAIQLPWRKDLSVGGNPMKLRVGSTGKTVEFKKGIGMQSFSQLLYANSNDFNRFKAVVGIDAETAGRGDCRMVVRGDGIELWTKRVRATDDPIPVEVDISGMKEVALVVYPGEDFDLSDHADWGEARFVKTK